MDVATKFLRLTKPVALDDRLDGWRVAWIGGWDRCRVLFVVMVEKKEPRVPEPALSGRAGADGRR
jgi:hypothetical protein